MVDRLLIPFAYHPQLARILEGIAGEDIRAGESIIQDETTGQYRKMFFQDMAQRQTITCALSHAKKGERITFL